MPDMWEQLYEGIELSSSPSSYIIFSQEVISEMNTYVQRKSNTPEAGGLLLGYIRDRHFDVRIITTPYPKDICRRNAFFRNDSKHIAELKKTMKESQGRIVYLGEWHTHPEEHPTPSRIDLNEWQKIKSTREYPMIFLILGIKSFFIKKY